MPDPRYAPAREDGTKPYVVTLACCGKTLPDRLVYVYLRSEAHGAAIQRDRFGGYLSACRRASPEDVTNLKEYR
jgi:hypothetical protein